MMLNKIFILWIAYALLMGFAVGGSFVSAFLAPQTTPNYSCADDQQKSANCQSPEERHQATEAALGYYTKWLMVYTGVMAFATIGLGIATAGLYLSHEKQFGLAKETTDRQAMEIQDQLTIARNSASAAQKSADAAVAAERARFYAVIDDNFLECINAAGAWDGPIGQEERPLAMNIQPMAGIRFKNYGKTPGFVAEVSTGIEYSETIPDPVYDEKVVMENIIAAGGCTEKFGTLILSQLTMAQAKKVQSGEGTIWIFGKVGYDDVFGERQTHRFFQRLVRVNQFRYVLQAYDYRHYNRST